MVEEKKTIKPKIQNLTMENREKLTVTGVIDVESFNEDSVIVITELGTLMVRGEDLHINRLNLDNSELIVEGDIISCEYSDTDSKSKGLGFFSRIFK